MLEGASKEKIYKDLSYMTKNSKNNSKNKRVYWTKNNYCPSPSTPSQ